MWIFSLITPVLSSFLSSSRYLSCSSSLTVRYGVGFPGRRRADGLHTSSLQHRLVTRQILVSYLCLTLICLITWYSISFHFLLHCHILLHVALLHFVLHYMKWHNVIFFLIVSLLSSICRSVPFSRPSDARHWVRPRTRYDRHTHMYTIFHVCVCVCVCVSVCARLHFYLPYYCILFDSSLFFFLSFYVYCGFVLSCLVLFCSALLCSAKFRHKNKVINVLLN
jgi:hypothetical protein